MKTKYINFLYSMLMRMSIGTAIMKNSMEVPQKIKNNTTI